MSQAIFDLRTNPFFRLNAKFRSSAADIANLLEDAEFEGRGEPDELHRAQHSIVTPKTRLAAELGWFPGVDETQIDVLTDILRRQNAAEMKEMLPQLSGLARANMAAHMLSVGSGSSADIGAIVESWDNIQPLEIARFLDRERRAARISSGGIGEEQVAEALEELRRHHAKAAAIKIWEASKPGEVMTRIVEAELDRNPSGGFLGLMVREYDSQSEAELSRILAEVDTHIKKARRCDESLSEHIGSLAVLLHAWDEINQPVQLYEQSRGMEEARSRQLHGRLRDLCLELANEHHRYSDALKLSEAMLATFPELESVAGSIRKDITDLEVLSEQQAVHQALGGLISACDSAKASPGKLRSELLSAAFDESASGELWGIVKAFRAASRELDDPTPAYMIIRDLALHLNNEDQDPETAFLLVDAVLKAESKHCPATIGETFRDERAILHKNWMFPKLEANRNNPSGMLRVIDKLLVYANSSDRADLTRLRGQIARRKWSQNTRKFVRYVMFGGVVVTILVAILDQPSPRSSYSAPAPSSSAPWNDYATAQPPDSSFKPPAASSTTPTNPYEEREPSIGRGLILDRSQVRYCVFQGDRLDNIKAQLDQTSNYQVDSFNALVNDYNSRCSYFRYQPGAVHDIKNEALFRADALRSDAERILSRWRAESLGDSTYSTPTPSTPSIVTQTPSASKAPTAPTVPQSTTLAFPPRTPTYHRSYSQDLRGADLTKDGFRGISIEKCESICTENAACKGYTYIVKKQWCWPKSSTIDPIYGKPGLISGYKLQ